MRSNGGQVIEVATLDRVVREGFTEKVTSEPRPGVGKSLMCSGKVMFSFVRNCRTLFHSSYTVFTFPSGIHEKLSFSIYSPAFGIITLFKF